MKSHLEESTSLEIVQYTNGKVIKTNTDPVVLEMISGYADYCCALLSVQEGDVFCVTGKDASAVHLAVFTDSSGNKLYEVFTQVVKVENLILIAPKGASYLVLNSALNGDPKCVKCYPVAVNTPFEYADFEKGAIVANTGANVANSNRLRSKTYISDKICGIESDTDGKFCVFAYKTDGTFYGLWDGINIVVAASPVWLPRFYVSQTNRDAYFGNLKFRIVFEHASIPSNCKVYSKVGSLLDVTEYLNKKIDDLDIPVLPDMTRYEYTSDDYFVSDDGVELASSSTALFALYDALVTAYPSVVSKNILTSGSLTNYEYVFTYGNYNVSGQRPRDAEIVKPTILITSGVHGDEKSAIMSTYALLKAMCEGKHPATSILAKCKIRVIPCVTPWGFDNNKRWNANGVNINRNFDAGWTAQGEAYTNNYSGESPASEDETKIVQNWIDTYKSGAIVHFDFHNSGYTSEVSYLSIKTDAANAVTVKKAYLNYIGDISGYWEGVREMSPTSLIFGYTGYSYTGGGCDAYGTSQGVFSSLIETSWNQDNTGLHSNKTIGIGCEALSCVLLAIVKTLIE